MDDFPCGKESLRPFKTSARLARLIVTSLWGDTDTHLRLDRGVYGGVGFSRDLSLRERRRQVRKFWVLTN